MTINIEELKRDREAGTPGGWTDDCREHDEPYQPIKIKGGRHTVCSVWMDDAPVHDFNAMQRANARRITRLPDLEAAFLEAVERQGRQYHVGPLTFDRVFRAGQLENLYDMQAVLDAVERALEAE